MTTKKRSCSAIDCFCFLILLTLWFYVPDAMAADEIRCPKVGKTVDTLKPDDALGQDLTVTGGECTVEASAKYHLGNVNIYNGGKLFFKNGHDIEFWARSILVENEGSLIAGCKTSDCSEKEPIGSGQAGGKVTIFLYGGEQDPGTGNGDGGQGIICQSDAQHHCGISDNLWNDGDKQPNDGLPGGAPKDYFYAYEPLTYDDGGTMKGYFGYKVLAVSYGGTLQLFGANGATYDNESCKGTRLFEEEPLSSSCTSWARLDETIGPNTNATQLKLDRMVDWFKGDEIVVTTTDYLPGHSERLIVANNVVQDGKSTITVQTPVSYRHNGEAFEFPTPASPGKGIDRLKLGFDSAETRAAVALLSRSIRIVSAGDTFDSSLDEKPGNYFGAHTIVRQGFKKFQVQGVEFKLMGQGGRIKHYPVHFHMARKVPPDTFIRDSSVNESMTRWYVVHGTHDVELARNVGYKSIGHGYYLEDGTEINNRFYSNIGIFARAAVKNEQSPNKQNPREVPGILASPELLPEKAGQPDFRISEQVPFHSDYMHPTIFWIMNGYNEFAYNMAVGAGTCGTCYWLVPGYTSGESRFQQWDSYASMQNVKARAAMTPLKRFRGNYCSTAMNAFNVVGDTATCHGVDGPRLSFQDGLAPVDTILEPVPNPLAPYRYTDLGDPDAKPVAIPPTPVGKEIVEKYYPNVDSGGGRFGTRCDSDDCSTVSKCAAGNTQNCMVTVLDHFTTAFNWAQHNFSAIWLRPQWSLVINSVISDVQNAGLTFVTGGDYTNASSPGGNWLLARKSVFIGETQGDNPYASAAGPFNPDTGLDCDNTKTVNYCLSHDEGISMLLDNFANNQRLFNLYDGPAQQDSNAYLNIKKTVVTDCKSDGSGAGNKDLPAGNCSKSGWMYGKVIGMPKDTDPQSVNYDKCYLPHAAIAWKQSNGFYYPPSFHSTNLFFDHVDIRHFVINPLFNYGTFVTNDQAVKANYCTYNPIGTFTGFTDIDRQTVLNDDDGSLTGYKALNEDINSPIQYKESFVVNKDPFFNAPVHEDECRSNRTAITTPYDYVTTVIYPDCAANIEGDNPTGTATAQCQGDAGWAKECSNQQCYGVPMYRQYVTEEELNSGDKPVVRMMQQAIWQRNNLTVNHGKFYIDTTATQKKQQDSGASKLNVFRAGETYHVFLIYAKPTTKQTYQMFIGRKLANPEVKMIRAVLNTGNFKISQHSFPSSWGDPGYDSDTGLLTVTMNMDFDEFKTNYQNAKKDGCQPANFCRWDDSSKQCKSALSDKNDLYSESIEKNAQGEEAICSWAVKDIECPKGGCYGFSVKMTGVEGDFEIGPDHPDPHPQVALFSENPNYDWNVDFISATPDVAGIECFSEKGSNVLTGTPRTDFLVGTIYDDIILGGDGDDIIFGRSGNDWIAGDAGNDAIYGAEGDDVIEGGAGDDKIYGHSGNDQIDGGSGTDVIDGGTGVDGCINGEGSQKDCE